MSQKTITAISTIHRLAIPIVTGILTFALATPVMLILMGILSYDDNTSTLNTEAIFNGLASSAPLGTLLYFTIFFSPVVLGIILLYLGHRLKIAGDTINGYGMVLAIGYAVIAGYVVALTWVVLFLSN